jgi:hypothetical protein
MNIFYLAHNPTDCAQMHCDKHVVKMILETAQLLSTAHHERGSTAPYKPTHRNHPSAVWVRSGVKQYRWAYSLLEALSDEYTLRYGKVHKTWERCSEALSQPPEGIADLFFTPPPQCMPDECKHSGAVTAYRNYYTQKNLDWIKVGRPMVWTGVDTATLEMLYDR